jgi:hypothetical protein
MRLMSFSNQPVAPNSDERCTAMKAATASAKVKPPTNPAVASTAAPV